NDDVAEPADLRPLGLREHPVRPRRIRAQMRDVDREGLTGCGRAAGDSYRLEPRRRPLVRALLEAARDPDIRRRLRDEPPVLRHDEEAVPNRTRREVRVTGGEHDCLLLVPLGKAFERSVCDDGTTWRGTTSRS